ncbi:MAG: hypothetical protein GX209_10355 [Epulopiscium sp.]|nr:hypothetical protein [Candidatus Epulonipiscium sp.]
MKLSKREILLLVTLFVILIGYGYYYYIYRPIQEKISVLEEQVAHAEQSVKEYQLKAIPENKLYEDYEHAVQHTTLISNRYYSDILQSEIILDIKDIIERSGIEVSSMKFSNPTYTTVTPRSEGNGSVGFLENLVLSFNNPIREENQTTQDHPEQNEQVKYMSITLNFTGTYNSIKSFINGINNNRYQLIINNIVFNSAGENGRFVGTAAIDVYSIPHIVTERNLVSSLHVS